MFRHRRAMSAVRRRPHAADCFRTHAAVGEQQIALDENGYFRKRAFIFPASRHLAHFSFVTHGKLPPK